jgi:hypothetical protein
MTADRIKEIQAQTAFPDSVSVCQALLQVWNECEQNKKYTEEDIKNAINVGMSAEAGDYPKGWSFDCGISLEDYFINSLNKK